MKIEKCPFCGKEVAEISNCRELEECRYFEKCPSTELYVCVVCNMHEGGCGASSGYYDSEAKAIAAWNRRVNLGSCENELIVRCGNCKHYNRIGCSDGFGWCERMDRGTNDDFYCSLAERSEGQ